MGAFKFAKTVLKSTFKKPATLMYPVVEREWQERTRGSIDIDADKCILCGICGRKCPADAINVDRKGGKWEIHRMQCVQCGACVEACPKKCLDMNPKYTEPGTEKVVDSVDVEVKKPEPKRQRTNRQTVKRKQMRHQVKTNSRVIWMYVYIADFAQRTALAML